MSPGSIRSVVNALRILDLIGENHALGVREAARSLDMPRSSVQRALETLHEQGWIEPTGAELTRWRLTGHMFRVARNATGEFDLRHVALPVMEELRRETEETIHLCIPDRGSMVLIERLESPQPVRTFVELGIGVPIFASAVGKAAVSTWSNHDIGLALADGLPSYTKETITDASRLMREIEDVRRLGYAINRGEWRDGVSAVASPIINRYGFAVAAISISAPSMRMDDRRRIVLGPLVKRAAEAITSEIVKNEEATR